MAGGTVALMFNALPYRMCDDDAIDIAEAFLESMVKAIHNEAGFSMTYAWNHTMACATFDRMLDTIAFTTEDRIAINKALAAEWYAAKDKK